MTTTNVQKRPTPVANKYEPSVDRSASLASQFFQKIYTIYIIYTLPICQVGIKKINRYY